MLVRDLSPVSAYRGEFESLMSDGSEGYLCSPDWTNEMGNRRPATWAERRVGGIDFPAPARWTPRGYKWSFAPGISVLHALRTPPRSTPRHVLRAGDTAPSPIT